MASKDPQLKALRAIAAWQTANGRAPTYSEMARELRVSRAAVTKTLQILERKGLVRLPTYTVVGEIALTAAGEVERAKGKT